MRLFLPLLLALSLRAMGPQEAAPQQRPAPKNLKILSPDEVRPAMRAFTVGLGVKCDFCHVEGNFASDDKRAKLTARNMITMTREINAHFKGEKERVSCYTCHRAEHEPKAAPPAQ